MYLDGASEIITIRHSFTLPGKSSVFSICLDKYQP